MGDRQDTLGRRTLPACIALVALVAVGCGRSGYQYLENDDSTVFAKIPEHWEVVSEGIVDFTLVGEDGQLSILPGDDTLPWRAVFDASPTDSTSIDSVFGAIEVQPVDRRIRGDIDIPSLLGFDPNGARGATGGAVTTVNGDEVVILAVADVQQDEVSGVRVIYQATTPGGLTATVDRQILTDDRHTAVYEVRLFCDIECFESNAEVIDEIMETFTVEVG